MTDKSKNILRVIKGIVLVFASVIVTSCNVDPEETPRVKPHYILNGSLYDSDATFDYYSIGNNELAVSLKDTNKTSLSSFSIPSSYDEMAVTGIWHNAFHNNIATSITLPETIKYIDFEAFFHSAITSITFPVAIEEIGDCAFYSCNDLVTATFRNSSQVSANSAIQCNCEGGGGGGEYTTCTLAKIPTMCFFNCRKLTSLTLPASITEVCEDAFNGCSALSSSIFFQNITTIRSRAFQGCISLRKVYVSKSLFYPASNTGIEPHAFNYCHDELDIRFCGTQARVEAWVDAHPKWGWRTDTGSPEIATNCYDYNLETGDTYFTSDWQYTCNENGEVTITAYSGPMPDAAHGYLISIPDHMDSPAVNRVTKINVDIFKTTAMKNAIRRLYLPTTLLQIPSLMFRYDYTNLFVIDDNTACASDDEYASLNDIPARIDLSGITDLEFIGIRAFCINNPTAANLRISSLHLPAKIRAIGGECFGKFADTNRSLPNVTTFKWDYDENESCLECIGFDAFYGLGCSTAGEIKENEKRNPAKIHNASTIIFPKTFKYFGLLASDVARYNNLASNDFNFSDIPDEKPSKWERPAHAFLGCSLLGKVIFKGSSNEAETTDLIIPLQTFVFNENLETIVFEERKNHKIVFHTQDGATNYHRCAQPSIGSNSGEGKNDFRGSPFLHTLVLPNKDTDLYIQDYAFHGNSRATIYLSNTYGTKMYRDKKNGHWTSLSFEGTNDLDAQAKEWKAIGTEDYYDAKWWAGRKGYCFTSSNGDSTSNESNGWNSFGIRQELKCYDNVHYYEKIYAEDGETVITTVEVGSGNTKEYVEQDKCSFVCEEENSVKVATMTNYLYNNYDGSSDASLITCKVPETVTDRNSLSYTVKYIGDNAFSACFCDGTDTLTPRTVGVFADLRIVELPNNIVSIGDYAFIRAYGLTTIKSYTGAGAATEGMPSSLKKIGKHAFAFCGIKQVLKIPYECVFYENYTNTYNVASVFANSVSLRKITFLDSSSNEGNESKYYKSVTYTSTTAGTPTYTGSLYSKDATGTDYNYNKDRLLLVLNRTSGDFKQTGADTSLNTGSTGLIFDNSTYNTNPFLFGAFKMGYFLKGLKFGSATLNTSSVVFPQPLFSAIGTRASNGAELTVKYVYLNIAEYYFVNLACDLETVTGTILNMPGYGLKGCEKLTTIALENKNGGEIPKGLFMDNTATGTNYTTSPAPSGGTARILDLRGTGYTSIGQDAFRNNKSIQQFIAPNVGTFTIGSNAFQDCTNLTTIDLRNVTTKIVINGSAFNNTGVTTILWPTDTSVQVVFNGASVFANCKSLVNATIHEGTTGTNSSTFSGCTNLESITTANGGNCNIDTIGNNCFQNCSKLNSFAFSKFPNLRKFNNYCFNNAGKLTDTSGDGVLTFNKPSGSTTDIEFGLSAFQGSKITTINFNSDGNIKFNDKQVFYSCTALTAVRVLTAPSSFTAHENVYSQCTSLRELQVPSVFNTGYTKNYINGDPNDLKLYIHNKFASNSSAAEKWRQVSGSNTRPVIYLVSEVSDLTTGNLVVKATSPYTVNKPTIEFWYPDANGVAVYLGTVSSYNGTTITFSSGYTLVGSTFAPPV